ncbi:transcription factor HES-2-like isoform X1 [Oncorhynchus mykiss]|uniref:transcription factor HES-2-like isoform X1 n=1 Tax=Oncorhynchus mykiss TaxID=8022 RepID=UPI001878911F|nr:transcription factor HES-2-like isoform X1 [Oncorhynchus mykiss]
MDGGPPSTRETRINTALSLRSAHSSSPPRKEHIASLLKAQLLAKDMTPRITPETTQLVPSRSTVAQRKEANELRKTLKPLLEKKRRARINDSLGQLKTLILPLVGKDNAPYSKLEKANILEMTVRFLRDLPSSSVKSQYYFRKLILSCCVCVPCCINMLHICHWIIKLNFRLFFPPGSSDSYKEGYKACLQRVTALIPKTNLDKDSCQRVNDFIQQAMSASVDPACQNCCAQSSRAFPQIQQRLLSLKANVGSRIENHSNSLPNRPQPVPQTINANMWRPW